MKPVFKLLAAALIMVVLGLFSTGIERIYWMFSGSGLVAVVPKKIYQSFDDILCDRPSVEIKRDDDGVLRYRCGSYWMLANGSRTPALTQAWPDVKRQLQK